MFEAEQGDKQRAAELLERYLVVKPDGDDADTVRSLVERLGQ